jgi:hypothetical protein
MACGVV